MQNTSFSLQDDTPRTLIQRLHEGSPDDWTTFFQLYTPVVLRLAEMFGLDRPDADDVTQIVMCSLQRRLCSPMEIRKTGRFRSYVVAVVRHEVLRHFRANSRRRAASIDDHRQHELKSLVPEPVETLMTLEKQSRVRLCLDRLRDSPKTKRRNYMVFHAYVIEERNAKEIAKRYGIAVQRVFEIKREMLFRLEKMLREFESEFGTS